jgi:pimeloyl-ACP methyl ester carboxylesterase
VPGGELAVARWGEGPVPVIAAHGITSSSAAWRAVARHVDRASTTLWAPDLRGRGASATVGSPYGVDRHADDLLAVADHAGAERFVLIGHSLGAYIALLAATRAERGSVAGLVLVDGGLPLPAPGDDVDPDAVLDATLGPAIERLGRVFPDWAAYEAFWREHPALASDWNEDVVAYLRYDVGTDDDGGLRSRVVPDAVRADGRDLLTGERRFGDALGEIACPVTLLRAPRGLFDEPLPFQPDELVRVWGDRVATLTDGVVEDVNHYTILMGDRGAPVVARALDRHVDACRSAP